MPESTSSTKPTTAKTVTPTSDELSGAKLKSEKDGQPGDQGKTVTLTAPGGTKVTAPESSAKALKAAGFK